MRVLDIAPDPQDHAAWHQRGMLAWSIARAQPRGDGRVTLTYDRDVPAAPVALDYLTVDASGLERATYTVTVAVEDLLTERRITRSSNLTIIE